jgi:deoxyadenosine/deoxycytidine kinase
VEKEELSLLLNELIANEVENFKEMINEYNNSGKRLLIKYKYLLSSYNLCNKFNIACNILDSQVLNPQVEHIIFPVPAVKQKEEEEFHF